MARENNSLERDDRITYPVRLLSLEGACKYLSCSNDLLEELIAMGDVPVIRLGREPRGNRDRRKRWVDRLDLDGLIESKKTGEGPGSGGLPAEQTLKKRGGWVLAGARAGATRLGVS